MNNYIKLLILDKEVLFYILLQITRNNVKPLKDEQLQSQWQKIVIPIEQDDQNENQQQNDTISQEQQKIEEQPKGGVKDVLLQLWYMILLSIMVIPQLYFNASVNALSTLLQPMFGDDIVSTSYLLVSIPTIFALIIFSVIFDSQGPKTLELCCGIISLIGTALCIVAVQPDIQNQGLFLFGRFLYGISGETICIGQSKFITLTIEKRFHAIAYAFAMIGLIGGELIAIATLPISNDLTTQVVSFLIMLYFFFIIRKQEQQQIKSKEQDPNQVSANNSFKQNFIIILKQLKGLSVYYYLLAITRFLMTACTKVFDSRAVYSMREIYGLPDDKLRSIITTQTITAEVVLVALCIIQTKVKKIQYFTLFGIICYCTSCLLFALGTVEDAEAYIYALSIINGFGLGTTISTCSALLVQIAGGNLGASALGYTYAVKYLLISILTPVAQAIGETNQRANGYMYFALHFIGGICLVIVICKKLGW